MRMNFVISKNTTIISKYIQDRTVNNASKILQRDILRTVVGNGPDNNVELVLSDMLTKTEDFFIKTISENCIQIVSSTPLGLMYGALEISRTILGIQDFWYFTDHIPKKKQQIIWNNFDLKLPKYRTKYRGWFINDELLVSSWEDRNSNEYVWERIYETLLRLGGNMIIPGTDKNSSHNRKAAQNMGLIYTHHHAEPLGAEMFARVYPNLKASYEDYPELFHDLWRTSIEEQKDSNVIYNLGFRGQGDCPFWAEDPERNWSDQEKADIINQIINLQYEMVHQSNPNAVCSINVYGELTELYNLGLLDFPQDVIEIWADNGYGRMVSRRQGSHDPREAVLTAPNEKTCSRGIYYHVAFHDLQAANFLTPLPNSPGFVSNELMKVRNVKMDELVIVNVGNIKPHILFLNEIARFWKSNYQSRSIEEIISEHVQSHYQQYQEEIEEIYRKYFEAIIQYGPHEDQKAGDEFSFYLIRKIIRAWLKNSSEIEQSSWLVKERTIDEQLDKIHDLVYSKIDCWQSLLNHAQKMYLMLSADKEAQEFFFNDIRIAIEIQARGLSALIRIIDAYSIYKKDDLVASFLLIFTSQQEIQNLCNLIKENPSDKWFDFYDNDGYTNITLTEEMIRTLLNYLRIIGDGSDEDNWERKFVMDSTESRVMLLSNTRKAMDDNKIARKIRENEERFS
ncbi:glycosyl hydrolase 115 family protein [Enterococcus sp. JM9B]|uniref:glycosyl hydrolase 115 family protein n=1 Tax=Enterococcus sp. JM9B TaxID=1857216 RepID=UPI001374AD4A|nr:glycosyl hydrolase 115 family protein [Enterococcus sp. JM9B]KAF1301884.1 hypothetical protein BAU16_08350 [Enterococcus sp. JM9B]